MKNHFMNEIETNHLDATLIAAWNSPEKLPDMSEWLREKRSEAAQAQYAFIILKKHFARAGVEMRKAETPKTWWSFGWDLYLNISELVTKREHSAMLKNLFVELVDFCQLFSGEFFAYNLLVILEKFIDGDPPRSLIMPLLPVKALEKMDEINEMLVAQHEDYLRRLDEMYY
jgi:hypothetical protein